MLVVLGVVGDVAGHVLLLEPTDAVLQAGCARNRPRPRQRLRITQVGEKLAIVAVRLGGELDVEVAASPAMSGISQGSAPLAR